MNNNAKNRLSLIIDFKVYRYNSAAQFYKDKFTIRVQKISVDAGFTCPNRDGHKGRGGCTYCNNSTFKPFYCSPQKSVSQQLSEGIAFFSKKYKVQKYLAYFQSYSNTYASVDKLEALYLEALSVKGVVGLVIATRPDCVDSQILDYLQLLSRKYFILLEYGVESLSDATLERINRKSTFQETLTALQLSKERGLYTGIHLIMGLPGESREFMLDTATQISGLDFSFLKLHQLQIIKHTVMAKDYKNNPSDYNLFTLPEYVTFMVNYLENLSPHIIVERFTSEVPSDMLIAPDWGRVKNFEIVHKIQKRLEELDTFQGAKYLR